MNFADYYADITSVSPSFPTFYTGASDTEKEILVIIHYQYKYHLTAYNDKPLFDDRLYCYLRLFERTYGLLKTADTRLSNYNGNTTNTTTTEEYTGSERSDVTRYENGINSTLFESAGNVSTRDVTNNGHSDDYAHTTSIDYSDASLHDYYSILEKYTKMGMNIEGAIEKAFHPLFITCYDMIEV